MQTISSRILTDIGVSISYVKNGYSNVHLHE